MAAFSTSPRSWDLWMPSLTAFRHRRFCSILPRARCRYSGINPQFRLHDITEIQANPLWGWLELWFMPIFMLKYLLWVQIYPPKRQNWSKTQSSPYAPPLSFYSWASGSTITARSTAWTASGNRGEAIGGGYKSFNLNNNDVTVSVPVYTDVTDYDDYEINVYSA